jgi:mono/diheme cytochrome c family protein
VIVAALVAIVGALLVWAVQWHRATATEVELGRRLYVVHCASCHGESLQGEPEWQSPKPSGRMPAPPHSAEGHTWHHSDQELFHFTKFGMAAVVPGHASDMPAFGGMLSDWEIEAVLAFIKRTWPEREREYQENRTSKCQGRKPMRAWVITAVLLGTQQMAAAQQPGG